MKQVEFAIAAPQIHTHLPVDTTEIRRYVQRAEALGFHSLWVQEQTNFAAQASALEGVTMLSYVAALTERVRIGSAVFLITLRNPVHLAKSLVSLDQLSQGRLIVGVGLGGSMPLYPAYGLSGERRVARFIEALTVMRRLWTEDPVTFDGQFWQLKDASLLPKPVQKPHPPIWFGGAKPPAIKRAARYGDGFIGAGSTSAADFRDIVRILHSALEEEKKDPASFPIGKRIYLAVDRDRDRALRKLRDWFSRYYHGRADHADQVCMWGSPQEVAEQVAGVIGSGAGFILLNPVADMMEQLEVLAGEVVPLIRRG